jgi:hypothetical protein
MQCEECGKKIRRAANHQRFCNDYCRGAYHRRKYRNEKYEAEVEAHEARINGHAPPDPNKKVDLVALGLVKPKPTLGLLPLPAQPKKKEEEAPPASAVGAEPVSIEEAERQIE